VWRQSPASAKKYDLVVNIEAGKVQVDARLPCEDGFGQKLDSDQWLVWERHFISPNYHLHQPIFLAEPLAVFFSRGLCGNRSHRNDRTYKENTG
jgi:hypothetical protein